MLLWRILDKLTTHFANPKSYLEGLNLTKYLAGMNGESEVREVDLLTGRVLRSRALPGEDFGEGIAKKDGRRAHFGKRLSWMKSRLIIFNLII